MSIDPDAFGDHLASLAQTARENGDFGLWWACITVLAHINPGFANQTLKAGIPEISLGT